MMDAVVDIRGSVLENLLDGVMVVERGGRVTVFNAAAGRILGLAPEAVVGETFAEIFIVGEEFEELSELILDAVAGDGEGGRQVVGLTRDGEARSLSVATSYIRESRDGTADPRALIAVFSDITELRELRETELRLAKAAEEQHGRLQDAYRQIEERNAALAAALRKVRLAQGLGIVLVLAMFLGAGFFAWQPLDLFEGAAAVELAAAGPVDGSRTLTVDTQRVSSSVTLKGQLAPWRKVPVRSGVDGTIALLNFEIGDEVSEGEVLLELDLSQVGRRYQRERVAYAKTREAFEKLDNWEASPEMASARRTFSKATLEMESQRNKMKKSQFLFDQGMIATDEHEDAKRQHQSQLLDFEAAEEEFAAVRAQGGAQAVAAARLEMETAREDMLALERSLEAGSIVAPVTGVVLAPARAGKELAVGGSVRRGDRLLTIGDFSRLAATAQVDEVDVGKLERGQKVSVSGNAFRDLRLSGVVSHVAAEADARSRGIPKFNVVVTLDPLEPAARARLKAGMSGRLRIVTYSNPKALLVPIDAVSSRGGTHRVLVLDEASGEAQEREVEIGPTTRDSVEVSGGLKAGETIVLPEG